MKNRRIHSWLISISLFASAIFLSQCEKPGMAGSLSPANKNAGNLTTAALTPPITSFVHPGVLNTQASLV
ncbi:MAG TPA: hypothetical protein VF939_07125 [Puia sp.]